MGRATCIRKISCMSLTRLAKRNVFCNFVKCIRLLQGGRLTCLAKTSMCVENIQFHEDIGSIYWKDHRENITYSIFHEIILYFMIIFLLHVLLSNIQKNKI